MSDDRIELPGDGRCPCGSGDLLLARDQVTYTPVRKLDIGWDEGGTSVEAMDNGDPMGNVRLFCTTCGQYFFVPDGLG